MRLGSNNSQQLVIRKRVRDLQEVFLHVILCNFAFLQHLHKMRTLAVQDCVPFYYFLNLQKIFLFKLKNTAQHFGKYANFLAKSCEEEQHSSVL